MRLLARLVGVLLALPTAMLILLVSPWVVVRGTLLVSSRIGHYLLSTELLQSELEVGCYPSQGRTLDVYYEYVPLRAPYPAVCNRYLSMMWRRELRFTPYWLASPTFGLLDRVARGVYRVPVAVGEVVDQHDVLQRTRPHLHFSAAEMAMGEAFLASRGILPGEPFACLQIRDDSYRLDYPYRSFDVEDFVPAVRELVDRGYPVIRMGARVSRRFPWVHEKVVDYAFDGSRTEFLDIFLAAHCAFWVSTGSGIDGAAWTFRKPILLCLNAFRQYPASFDVNRMKADVHILPALVAEVGHDGSDRLMGLSEIFKRISSDPDCWTSGEIAELRIAPEQIVASVIEFLNQVAGAQPPSAEALMRQQRFWAQVPPSLTYFPGERAQPRCWVSDCLLRANPHLLETGTLGLGGPDPDDHPRRSIRP